MRYKCKQNKKCGRGFHKIKISTWHTRYLLENRRNSNNNKCAIYSIPSTGYIH